MKGVSEFVVVLIILIIAIASISMVWLFYNSMFGSVTTSENTRALGETLSSCMKIDSVKDNKVYLKNCGDGAVTNSSLRVYFDDAPVNFSMSPVSLGKGQVGTLSLYGLWGLSIGNHKLKITTESGKVERYVKANPSTSSFDGVLWFKFDENSGPTAYDSSAYHNDGTLINNPTWVNGEYGSALSFNGSNDYINVSDSSSLNITGDLTISAWIYWKGTNLAANHIVEKGSNDNDNYAFFIVPGSPNSALYFEFRNTSNNYNLFNENVGSVSKNAWQHVAVVYDKTNSKIYFYNNGTQTSSNTTTSSLKAWPYNMSIGKQNFGGGRDYWFNGTIDELRVYSRALSQTEIQNDMQGGAIGLTLGELA